jgi:chromosome partitioning protein
MNDLRGFSDKASDYLTELQNALNKPYPSKTAPTFSTAAVAELCGIARTQFRYLAGKHGLSQGIKRDGAKSRELSLEETIEWVGAISDNPRRNKDAGQQGRILAVCNYKGGVAKTSTAVSMAQALTLRGLKVLLVDCDAQGSASLLLGFNPEKDVDHEKTTILPFIHGDTEDLKSAVCKSYWHNLDLIPGCSAILTAEFLLPAKAMSDRDYRFWEVIKTGIDPLREEYDCIIFDTPPSLGHVTLNVMFAADGLLMPCTPDKLDFTSSVQFWSVFNDLASLFPGAEGKTYDFVTIIPTKVEPKDGHRLTKTWMQAAYGEFMNAIEIPHSAAANMALTQDRTIYDFTRPEGSPESYRRYKDPMNLLADYLLRQLETGWAISNKANVAGVTHE